jgi:hypothetical protein
MPRYHYYYGLYEVINGKSIKIGSTNIFFDAPSHDAAIRKGDEMMGIASLKDPFYWGSGASAVNEESEKKLREIYYKPLNEKE